MKQTRLIMGMPITIEIVDASVAEKHMNTVFAYFISVDERFSTYKQTSEITKINKGLIKEKNFSQDMKTVLALCEQTTQETNGYFNIEHNEKRDPSGLVKGWAIYHAYLLLLEMGFNNFYINAGGDVQVFGKNTFGNSWSVGIKNPFNQEHIVKKLLLHTQGIATSGTYIRGQHIYNPFSKKPLTEIISITVIGPNVYEADRFATAAFAMGKKGIHFIEQLTGFEGYMIDKEGTATYTNGFASFVDPENTLSHAMIEAHNLL